MKHNSAELTDLGEAVRDARALARKQEEAGDIKELPGRRNPDGSFTFSPGTKVTLRLGFSKKGATSPDDYAFRRIGEILLPVTVTVRRVETSFDLDKATTTRAYKVEPHDGDSAATKERFLQLLKYGLPSLFRDLPNAPVRAIRLDIATPGYKKVSKGKDFVIPVTPLVRKAEIRQGVRPPTEQDRPAPKGRAVTPTSQGQRVVDRGYGQRPFAPRDVSVPQRPPAPRSAHVWDNLSHDPLRVPVATPVRPIQPRTYDARPSTLSIRPARVEELYPEVDFKTNPDSLTSLEGLRLRPGITVDVRVGYRVPGRPIQHVWDSITLDREVEVDGSAYAGKFIDFSLSSPEFRRAQRAPWGVSKKTADIKIGLVQGFMGDKLYLLPIEADLESVTNVQFYPFGTKNK
jgi:hypothetical protein